VTLAAASGAAKAEWSANLEYERYRWTEPSVGVTEKGPLYGLGVGWAQEQPTTGWAFSYRGKYYFGSVDYSGGTLVGNQPVQATVDYNGLLNEVQAAYLVPEMPLRAVLGLGLDYWNRQLSSAQHEEWYVYFLRAGAEWGNRLKEGWFVGGGIKYPFYVLQNPHARSIGFDQDVKLHPKGTASLYADVGYRLGPHWTLSAFYDSYRFDQSPTERVSGATCTASFGVPTCGLLQPASNADMYGLRVYYHF
jgi:hypothetical protein